jgi:RNA polymerase sigma-70 factor (ECF subfamily)
MTQARPLDPLLAQRGRFKSFLTARLGNESDAEDVLQDGFIKAAQRIGELREDDRVTAWFYQVLRHAMIDHVRSRSAARQRELAWLEQAERDADEESRREACACYEALLPGMKPREAELLRRVELLNEPVAEAAAALGITANNASVILHRARKDLRQRLEQFCGECASGACLDCDCGPPADGGKT